MFIVTCDMPLITKELAEMICQEAQGCDVLIAVTSDGKYQPLCGVYKKELLGLMEKELQENNNRMREVLKKSSVKYLQLDEELSKQLVNVNTKEEYEKLICNK